MKTTFTLILFLFSTTLIYAKTVKIIENKEKIFQSFECNELKTDFFRHNDTNSCVIIQELSNEFEIKSNDFEKICIWLETIYVTNRIKLSLKGILLVGY